MYANGMSISFHSEPHVLAGTVTPTIGRCNISLPMENGLNSIEWRLRKEQIKGKVTVFGRKLRVSRICHYSNDLFFCGQTILHFEGCLSYFYLLKMCKSAIVFSMTIFSLFERSVNCMGSSAAISYRSFITKSIPKEVGKNTGNIAASHSAVESGGKRKSDHLPFVKMLRHTWPQLVLGSKRNYSLSCYVLLLENPPTD